MTVSPSAASGRAAEQIAADYLTSQGLIVIARNFRCRAGELDLVCLDAGILAIVEVRQRRRGDFGGALGSITCGKQRRLIRAAQFYLRCSARFRRHRLRFDVVALQGLPGAAHELAWVKDAFRAGIGRAT